MPLDPNVFTGIAVALSGVVTQSLNIYRERRHRRDEVENRKWDLQDRAAKAEHTVETVKAAVETTTTQTNKVLEKIQENTQISSHAFLASNDLNTKLLKVHRRMDDMDGAVVAAAESARVAASSLAVIVSGDITGKLDVLAKRLDAIAVEVEHNSKVLRGDAL
jgi:hypothetical protein